MAEIRWTIEAKTWLKNIYDYIAQDDPRAAAKVVEGIYEKAQILKEYPEIAYYRYRFSESWLNCAGAYSRSTHVSFGGIFVAEEGLIEVVDAGVEGGNAGAHFLSEFGQVLA